MHNGLANDQRNLTTTDTYNFEVAHIYKQKNGVYTRMCGTKI